MHLVGLLDHIPDARAKMELFIWVWTAGGMVPSAIGLRKQLSNAKSKAGNIKPGSTGPPVWTRLLLFAQFCGFLLPQLVYWAATACNGFRQPKWMIEHALPSPPAVLGIDGVVVGRAVGLLAVSAWRMFAGNAMKALGDQYYPIGVREKPRLVKDGPFAYVRHPIYTGSIFIAASSALLFWSYIPLYALFFGISGSVLKVPIEERTMVEDPVLGEQYKRYKIDVPYRIIPYIW